MVRSTRRRNRQADRSRKRDEVPNSRERRISQKPEEERRISRSEGRTATDQEAGRGTRVRTHRDKEKDQSIRRAVMETRDRTDGDRDTGHAPHQYGSAGTRTRRQQTEKARRRVTSSIPFPSPPPCSRRSRAHHTKKRLTSRMMAARDGVRRGGARRRGEARRRAR